MKKLVSASLFIAAASLALWSCDNGKYDADPNKDNTGVLNPLDTANNPVVQLGSIKGMLNGQTLLFSPAYFVVDTNGIRHVYAQVKDDSIYRRTIVMMEHDSVFRGKKVADISYVNFRYSVYDTVLKRNKYYWKNAATTDFIIMLNSDENKTMRGTINGPVFKQDPQPVNFNDSVSFKNVVFYIDERPFKK